MTELQALKSVRATHPHAIPVLVEFGNVQCTENGVVVASLIRAADGTWSVVAPPAHGAPPIVVPDAGTDQKALAADEAELAVSAAEARRTKPPDPPKK